MAGVWILFNEKGKEVKRIPEQKTDPDKNLVFSDKDEKILTINSDGRLWPPGSESPDNKLHLHVIPPDGKIFVNDSKSQVGDPGKRLYNINPQQKGDLRKNMDLISCFSCGIVLNKDKLDFPPITDDKGTHIESNSAWDIDEYISAVPCPVCSFPIKENGNA